MIDGPPGCILRARDCACVVDGRRLRLGGAGRVKGCERSVRMPHEAVFLNAASAVRTYDDAIVVDGRGVSDGRAGHIDQDDASVRFAQKAMVQAACVHVVSDDLPGVIDGNRNRLRRSFGVELCERAVRAPQKAVVDAFGIGKEAGDLPALVDGLTDRPGCAWVIKLRDRTVRVPPKTVKDSRGIGVRTSKLADRIHGTHLRISRREHLKIGVVPFGVADETMKSRSPGVVTRDDSCWRNADGERRRHSCRIELGYGSIRLPQEPMGRGPGAVEEKANYASLGINGPWVSARRTRGIKERKSLCLGAKRVNRKQQSKGEPAGNHFLHEDTSTYRESLPVKWVLSPVLGFFKGGSDTADTIGLPCR